MTQRWSLVFILSTLWACGDGAASGAEPPASEATSGGDVEPAGADSDGLAPLTGEGEGGQGGHAAPAPGKPPGDDPQRLSEEGDTRIALNSSDPSSRPLERSRIEATASEAAVRFFVVDKDKGPIEGIVISLQAPDGSKYYTRPSDEVGFAEVLVPNGNNYELVFLSLGRRKIAAKLPVSDEPKQNIKLTLRYKRHEAPPPTTRHITAPKPAPRFVLEGVEFDTGKATIRPESLPQLESVIEFMTHKDSAKIEIAGHTDNVGNPKANKRLSKQRAEAVRKYLMTKGIAGSRITAVGYGDEFPIADNATEQGRQRNRRIEAMEL